jgi:hypothetical protein
LKDSLVELDFSAKAVMPGLAKALTRGVDRAAIIARSGVALVLHGLQDIMWRAQMLRAARPVGEEIAEGDSRVLR